jgi:hypothetical protein
VPEAAVRISAVNAVACGMAICGAPESGEYIRVRFQGYFAMGYFAMAKVVGQCVF